MLWLSDLLDLRPVQRVLEIGSGFGWLAAVMARSVGKDGHVSGMEIIPEVAAQSQADLGRLGIDNVSVLAADGAEGHAADAPFDRVMTTAASWDLPTVLFDQVAEGGRVLVPIELRGGGCQVTVRRREGERFVAERAVEGWFVPLFGRGQQRPAVRVALKELPFWDEIGRLPPRRVPLPLAGWNGAAGGAVSAFRAFLGRPAAGFAIFGEGDPPEPRLWLPAEPFGILNQSEHSVALWSRGELCWGPFASRQSDEQKAGHSLRLHLFPLRRYRIDLCGTGRAGCPFRLASSLDRPDGRSRSLDGVLRGPRRPYAGGNAGSTQGIRAAEVMEHQRRRGIPRS